MFFILFLKGMNVYAQTESDSFLIYLSKIKGKYIADSINAGKAYNFRLNNNRIYRFDDEKINKELNRIEKVSDNVTYLTLAINSHLYYYFDSQDSSTQKYVIEKGTSIVDKYDYLKDEKHQVKWILLLKELRKPYRNGKYFYDGIEYFGKKANQYKQEKHKNGLSTAYNVLAAFNNRLGLLDKGEYYQLKSIENLDQYDKYSSIPNIGLNGIINRYSVLGSNYNDINESDKAEKYLSTALKYLSKLDSPSDFEDVHFLYLQYAKLKGVQKNDSTIYYFKLAKKYHYLFDLPMPLLAYHEMEKGVYFYNVGSLDSASIYLNSSIIMKDTLEIGIHSFMGYLIPNYFLAKLELLKNNPRKAIKLLLPEIDELKAINGRLLLVNHLTLLAETYEKLKQFDKSISTYKEVLQLKNEINSDIEKARALNYEIEKKIETDNQKIIQLELQNNIGQKTKKYLYGIVGLLILLALSFVGAYLTKQKNNKALNKTNLEIQNTLYQLKSTQAQLIQSEKMASLGQLTAGIAHEIQNPLNFVNNFSEVSNELIDEMKDEIKKGNYEEVSAIANDVKQNIEKINHHGKRADAIVKSMLEHSRIGTGQKDITDINVLCDEYLRLSYHGLRAKDNTFNASFQTHFDATLPAIKVIPQDIGRVLLNIINNAFYAVNERSKMADKGYTPEVSISTARTGDMIEIKISDNGGGIPDHIKEKIFQPFFTTKPTGQGTGLGLSLSYDIVKAHGGELKVVGKEKEGSEFLIQLPLLRNQNQ
jgi:signal transduction histidine kinase